MAQPEEDASEFFAAGGVPYAEELLLTEKGSPKALLFNAITALAQDRAFFNGHGPAIRFDDFRCKTMVWAPLPWDQTGLIPRPWTDDDDREVTAWIQSEAGITVGELVAGSAVQAVAARHKYHPLMEYLQGLSWDGEHRIDEWLIRYCGAEDTEYIRAVGSKWLISACARIENPGCQADCVLVFEGPQGIRKSTTFAVLGGEFYTNDIAALGTTASQEQILGKWIVELDELNAVTRASDVAAVTSFVSRRIDNFRLPYAHRSNAHPRQCVFGGTTNRSTWMRDETGGRRWWPLWCEADIDIESLRRDRDQLWAEAHTRFSLSEPWWMHTPHLVDLAQQEQEKRFEEDPWQELIIGKAAELGMSRTHGVTVNEILAALQVPAERRSKTDTSRIGAIARHLGWDRRAGLDFHGESVWKLFKPK